jgi:predicted nucleotidyltransferase
MADGFFGPLGDSFAAASDDELRDLLARVDATVPDRTQGGRSEHRERYSIVHYLRTLERHGLLSFPFKISKDEGPDFQLEMGSQIFGLEHTDAGSPEFQKATTALEKAPKGSWLVGTVVSEPGEPPAGRGFVGDEPQQLWTEQVLAAIRKKTEELLPSYRELPDYQLLVYDNTELVAVTGWSVTELPGRLAAAIQDWRVQEPDARRQFSRISVLRDRVLMFDVTDRGYLLPVPPSPSLPPLVPLTRLGVPEEDLQEFCRHHHIRKLGFFGSVREERFGPDSDVDVLVEFEPDVRIGLIRLAGIELELTELLGRKADLRTVPDLSRYFREEVVREKTDLVYAAG